MTHELPVLQDQYQLLEGRQKQIRSGKLIFWVASSLATIGLLCACVTWSGIFTLSSAYVESSESHRNSRIILWSGRPKIEDVSRNNINNDIPTEGDQPQDVATTSPIIVCYYTIPREMNSTWELSPSGIDSHICTHVIVGFASVVNSEISLGDASLIYKRVAELKNREPGLKVMLSAGGMSLLDGGFSEMVKTHANRKRFIKSVLNVIKELNYDGLDVDWEFPAWMGADAREKIYFVQLLQEIRKAFDSRPRQLILSIAVAAPVAIIDQSYDIPIIAEYVDFVSVMSYDYHFYVWYFPITGHNAPLYARTKETGYDGTLNVNYSAMYWLANGMPSEKLVIGVPTYGHSYQLDNSFNHEISAPATGVGKLGIDGYVPYPTVCAFLKQGATRHFDDESKVPYVFKDKEWVSYEDTISAQLKAEWIKAKRFKGAMIFSLNADDWNATCLGTKENENFPLTRTVNRILRSAHHN